MHGGYRTEFFDWSNLLPEGRHEIKRRLADLGYEWPENDKLSKAILRTIAKSRPTKQFKLVRAPGWYESVFVIPGKVFSPYDDKTEVYIDSNTDAHVGAFVLGEGSLADWKKYVAKPSRKSTRLRLSIAAALAATFLRPLGFDSFGINLFSQTSDGKTVCLIVAASVTGLVGVDGLPGWADSESGIEDQARGHRDCVMPQDETSDGEHQMPIEKKARMLAFLIARNRPRKLSKKYERDNNLANREFRIISLSSSERALGQIARAAGGRRLGGEEVRLIDVPASEPGTSGIFDGTMANIDGKTLRETTKELVDELKANAIKYQGHAIRALLKKYVRDSNGLKSLKQYMDKFEAKATIPDSHNAHLRVRHNFAVIFAAAALAIDYGILPWRKKPTFLAIKKCMLLALATLETGAAPANPSIPVVNAHRLCKMLKEHLAGANLVRVEVKQKVSEEQTRERQRADGFIINGEIYLKPDHLKRWVPAPSERGVLKEREIIRTERDDTATVERKIGGIEGKPRYYAINVHTLDLLAAGQSA